MTIYEQIKQLRATALALEQAAFTLEGFVYVPDSEPTVYTYKYVNSVSGVEAQVTPTTVKQKRTVSPQSRKKMAAAQKRRWKAYHEAKKVKRG